MHRRRRNAANPFFRARHAKGMTVADFALAMGVSPATLAALENEVPALPIYGLTMLAALQGVAIDQLGADYIACRNERRAALQAEARQPGPPGPLPAPYWFHRGSDRSN